MNKEELDLKNIFGLGKFNEKYAEYFTSNSYLNPLTDSSCPIFMANVSFEPGCINNWHIHHAKTGGGQILICTAGFGIHQIEGEKVQFLKPGDVVVVPANVKYFHGALKDSWFSHIAIEVPGEDTYTEWLELVDYDRLVNND